MKIAYLVNTLPIHPTVTDQIRSLVGRGHEISIISIFPPTQPREEIEPILTQHLVVAAHVRVARTFLLGLATAPGLLFRLIRPYKNGRLPEFTASLSQSIRCMPWSCPGNFISRRHTRSTDRTCC